MQSNLEIKTMQEAWERWGGTAQVMQLAEESVELAHACHKIVRKPKGLTELNKLAEEIADAEIMVQTVKMHLALNDLVASYRDLKMNRLKRRLDNVRP